MSTAQDRHRHKGSSLLSGASLLSTSIAVTAVFAVTGWMVQRYAANVSQHSLEEEIRTSLQAYQSLWSARVHNLTAISRIVSSMSDVRSAFLTRDRATIRDTAEQLWSQVSEQDANFLVLDPTGEVIASLGGDPAFSVGASLDAGRHQAISRASGGIRKARNASLLPSIHTRLCRGRKRAGAVEHFAGGFRYRCQTGSRLESIDARQRFRFRQLQRCNGVDFARNQRDRSADRAKAFGGGFSGSTFGDRIIWFSARIYAIF